MAEAVSRRPDTMWHRDLTPAPSVWEFWWINCPWDRFLGEYSGVHLSVPYHQCFYSYNIHLPPINLSKWYRLYLTTLNYIGRSQWLRGLSRRSAAASLPRLWIRIPPRAWMSVCYECCVLSGRGLCDELITRPKNSNRLCCVVVCDLETSRIGATYIYINIYIYDISSLRVNNNLTLILLTWRKWWANNASK